MTKLWCRAAEGRSRPAAAAHADPGSPGSPGAELAQARVDLAEVREVLPNPCLSRRPGPRARNVEVAAAGVPPRQSLARPACDAASMQASMRRLPPWGPQGRVPPAQAK